MAKETQSEDTAKRFEALGFDVQTVDGHELDAVPRRAASARKSAGSGKPQLIIAKTLIGKGIPEVEGTQKAHGEGGAKFADDGPQEPRPARRALLRLARGEARSSPRTRGRSTRRTPPGQKTFDAWQATNPKLAESWRRRALRRTRCPPTRSATPERDAARPRSPSSRPTPRSRRARRARTCCSRWRPRMPLLIGGSADLYGSTLNYIGDLKTATTTSSRPPRRAATSASASASTACARS